MLISSFVISIVSLICSVTALILNEIEHRCNTEVWQSMFLWMKDQEEINKILRSRLDKIEES